MSQHAVGRCAVFGLLFSVSTFAGPVWAGSRTVDGDPADWTGSPPAGIHREAESGDEWIYRGAVGDRRGDVGATDEADLSELRLTTDGTYLYVLVRLVAIDDVAKVAVGLGIDTNQEATPASAGLNFLGDDSGLTYNSRPFVRPERVLVLHVAGGGTPAVEFFAGGSWYGIGGAQVAISAANDVVEARLPLADLNGLGGSSSFVLTAATFMNFAGWNNDVDTTVDFATTDAIDAFGAAGQSGNAWDRELQDGDLDTAFWIQLRGASNPPTAVLFETLYHSSCDQLIAANCAVASDHPSQENVPSANPLPSGNPPTFHSARRFSQDGSVIPGRTTDVFVYDDEPLDVYGMALAGDVTDDGAAPQILYFGSGGLVDMAFVENYTGSWHGLPSFTWSIYKGSLPPQPPGVLAYSLVMKDETGDRSLCRTGVGANTRKVRGAVGQWVGADGCSFADYVVSVLDDDTGGPSITNVVYTAATQTLCADVADLATSSGDGDSGVQQVIVRYAGVKSDVSGGAGSTTPLALQAGITYCATGLPFGNPTYYRLEATNNDFDAGNAADRETSLTSVLCEGGSCVLGAPGDNDVRWGELLHDTRDEFYREPFGALPTGSTALIRLRTGQDDITGATLRVYNTPGGTVSLPMSKMAGEVDPTFDWWEATLLATATASGRELSYKFLVQDGSDNDGYVDDHAHNQYDHEDRFENGTGIPVDDPEAANLFANSFKITVYDAAFLPPEWVAGTIIYQLMPDRFRNGDADNDDDYPYADVYGTPVHLHAAWNEAVDNPRDPLSPYHNKWSADFFGGDLQGVLDELDYLQSLGVGAIYFNPIFASPSNHGYDTADYLEISPRYGDNALFATLATEAENRGIKIILDGVFNHTGSDSVYLDRASHFNAEGEPALGNDGSGACEGAASPFAAFFDLIQPGSGGPCWNGQFYNSWWGYDSLPLLRDYVMNGAVRDFVFDVDNDGDNGIDTRPGVIQYWSAQGVDGWRFDVADELPHDFWQQFRNQVNTVDGLGLPMWSEVWYEAQPWLLGDQMDATMNYRLRKAILGFLVDSNWTDNDNYGDQTVWKLRPSEFDSVLGAIAEDYPEEAWVSMMNLVGSHDTSRALFALGERSANLTAAIAKMKMLASFLLTYPGAATVYYGDEAGLGAAAHGGPAQWGAGYSFGGILQDDPYNRHPFPWTAAQDPYAEALVGGFDSVSGSLPGTLPDEGLREVYRRLGQARANTEVLRAGGVVTLLASDPLGLYAYARVKSNAEPECALVVLNRSTAAQPVTLADLPNRCDGLTFVNLFGGAEVSSAGGTLSLASVPGLSAAVLLPAFDDPNTTETVATLPLYSIELTTPSLNGPASIGDTQVHPFDAVVRDVAGRTVAAGVRVSFEIRAGAGSFGLARATTVVVTTDTSGRARALYEAPPFAEFALVEARVTQPSGRVLHDASLFHLTSTTPFGVPVDAAVAGRTQIGPESVGELGTTGLKLTKFGRGEPVLASARFTANPYLGPATLASSFAIGFSVGNTNVDKVVVRQQYGVETGEENHQLYFWNGNWWQPIPAAVRDTTANTLAVEVTAASTPSLTQLAGGLVFVVGQLGQADLSLDLSVSTTSLAFGETLTATWTLTSAPASPSAATNIRVKAIDPAMMTQLAANASAGTFVGGTWSLPSLAPGATATLQLSLRATAIGSGDLYRIEVESFDQIDPDSSPGNGSVVEDDLDSVTFEVAPAEVDVRVNKSNGTFFVLPGAAVNYDIVVSNAGPDAAFGVQIADNVPLSLQSCVTGCVATSGGSCAVGSGPPSVAATADLPAGGSATLSLDCTLSPSATGFLSNTASVVVPEGHLDAATGDDVATDVDHVGPPLFADGFESGGVGAWSFVLP